MENYRNKSEKEKRVFLTEQTDVNVFVEAGAGAGKTRTIVDRIVNQLKNTTLRPENIVVITFTNAAVNELYERIQSSLKKALDSLSGSAATAGSVSGMEKLTYAFQNINRMHICTIHSFCLDLLKERGFDIGLSLDIKLMEDEEAQEEKIKFFRNYYRLHPPGSRIRAVLSYHPYNDLESTFLDIADMHDVRFVYDEERCMDSDDTYQVAAQRLLEELLTMVVRILSDGSSDSIEELDPGWLISSSETLFTEYLKKRTSPGYDFCSALKGLGKNLKIKKTCLGRSAAEKAKAVPKLDAIQEYLAQKADSIDEHLKNYEAYKYAICMQYLETAQKAYAASKNNLSVSNDELLYLAKRLITESREARTFFQEKYRCFYVDEFQDTDPCQTDMILALASENGRLKDGTLFLVGDPKQSIYSFRGADIRLYQKIKELFRTSDNAEVIEIQNNYRTCNRLIDWVNAQFSSILDDYHDMFSVPRISAFMPESGHLLNGVYKKEIPSDASSETYSADADAQNLCQLIWNLVHAEHWIYDKNSEKIRRIQYSDIMVLTEKTTDMPIYIKRFHDYGISVNLSGKYLPMDRDIIQRYITVLEYLEDPFDSMKKLAFHEQIAGSELTSVEPAAFYDSLIPEELIEACRRCEPMAAARILAAHPELYFPQNIRKNEVDYARADITQLLENMACSEYSSLWDLIIKMKKYAETLQKKELLLNPEANTVRFMNMHQSKGLESKIVIIANRKPNSKIGSGKNTYVDRNEDPWKVFVPIRKGAYDVISPFSLCTNPLLTEIAKRETDEFRRGEYVESTRAEELLIIMPQLKKAGGVRKEAVIPFADYEDEIAESIDDLLIQPAQKQEAPPLEDWGQNRFIPSETEDFSEQKIPVYIKRAPSRVEHVRLQQETAETIADEADALANVSDPSAHVPAALSTSDRPRGNIFGTVMHRCFELLVNNKAAVFQCADDLELQDIIKPVIHFAIQESAEKIHADERHDYEQYLNTVMEAFCQDKELMTYLKEAKQVHTEFPFTYTETTEDGQLLLCSGIMDLVLLTPDDVWVIIDYKSNDWGNKSKEEFETDLENTYETQLEEYKMALQKITGTDIKKIQALLYHLCE